MNFIHKKASKLNALSLVTATAITCLSALPSQAQEERRMDVKGMSLGITLAQAKALAKLTCMGDSSGAYDTVCRYSSARDNTFASEKANFIEFGFFNDRLDSADIQMPISFFSTAKAAMDSKFGEVTPSAGGVSTYMTNGDRAHLLRDEDGKTVLLFRAAAGAEERQKRKDAAKKAQRKDM